MLRPSVANAFFRAGKIESWGRGIERIQSACAQAGVPAPEIRLDHGGLWVVFNFAAAVGTQVETQVETLVQTRVVKPIQTPDKIIQQMRQQPELTLAAVAQAIGKSTSAVERAAAKLVQSGQIRHVGPTKTGRWEVLDGKA